MRYKLSWFCNFLRLGATGQDAATVSAYRRPLGYQQITSGTLAAATALTLPDLTSAAVNPLGTPNAPTLMGLQVGYVIIQCEGTSAGVRWRDDGTDPTASIGMILSTGQELDYSGDPQRIKFITQTGSPILNISYYAARS